MRETADQGRTTRYVYDDAGQRVIKRGAQGETVYVNQFLTVRDRGVATKHVFAGKARVASRMLHGKKKVSGEKTTPESVNEEFGLPNFLYIYHPDHLGSSNYVTDIKGKLYQHLQYFPFGETWVEQTSSKQRTPNWFTAKELDEDTGLYYFGARYYDPRTSMWISADPALDIYLPTLRDRTEAEKRGGSYTPERELPGLGGIFNSMNLGLFTYVNNNPVILQDPDGRRIERGNAVLTNPKVLKALNQLNSNIIKNTGKADSSFTLRISGGDRFIRNNVIISATTKKGDKAFKTKTSPHLQDRGARAVDFVATGVTKDQVKAAREGSGFRLIKDYTDSPHLHAVLPNRTINDAPGTGPRIDVTGKFSTEGNPGFLPKGFEGAGLDFPSSSPPSSGSDFDLGDFPDVED